MASSFQNAKIYIMETAGLAKDALHIYVGLIVFFAVILLFRLPVRDPRPLLAALLAALVGEGWDIYDTSVLQGPQDYYANWHDLWNTMFWPLVIFVLARWTSVFER